MIHRRILYDDKLGVGEALNETAYGEGLVVRGKHYLNIEYPNTSALYHRVHCQQLYLHPIETYSLINSSYLNYSFSHRQTWSALTDSLPLNIHLLTFDQLNQKDYLIRLEHYFELNEDILYSFPTKINLQSIFNSIGIINNILELTLTADLQLSHVKRLQWIIDNEKENLLEQYSFNDTNIILNPMQIRTFRVTIL